MLGMVIRAQYCERKYVYWKSHAHHAHLDQKIKNHKWALSLKIRHVQKFVIRSIKKIPLH